MLCVGENLAEQLKVTKVYSKLHRWVGRVLVLVNISCLCLVPFLRYSALNNGVPLYVI